MIQVKKEDDYVMKKTKKFLSLALASTMAMTLAACGGGSTTTTTAAPAETTTAVSNEAGGETAAPAEPAAGDAKRRNQRNRGRGFGSSPFFSDYGCGCAAVCRRVNSGPHVCLPLRVMPMWWWQAENLKEECFMNLSIRPMTPTERNYS